MTEKFTVGFMGGAGAGKTSAALALWLMLGDRARILSFSSPMKSAVKQLFMLTDVQVYGTKADKEIVDPRWGVSPRTILQKVGTDCIRDMLCKDFFVRRMREAVKTSDEEIIIIDDVRFADEARICDFCVGIRRDGLPEDSHASEQVPWQLADLHIKNSGTGLLSFQYDVQNILLKSGVLPQ